MASAACHRADGGGLVGPAFTDNSYIHGGRYADIAMIITEGVADKGMIASSKQLKQEEMQDLTCDVRALRDSTVEDAKAPQGTKAVDAVVPMPWRRLTLRPPSPGPQRPGARFARAPRGTEPRRSACRRHGTSPTARSTTRTTVVSKALVELTRDRPTTISESGHRNWLYPASFGGVLLRRRTPVNVLLMALFFGLLGIEVGGHQAVLLGRPRRKLALVGLVL